MAKAKTAAARQAEARWKRENRERVNRVERARRAGFKQRVVAAYGGACTCCGESEITFLTVDHVNGRLPEHRRRTSKMSGWILYKHVEREGYPDTYTILCFNCNSGRAINGGVCPHQIARQIGPGQNGNGTAGPELPKR
jgi:hypothetical protein